MEPATRIAATVSNLTPSWEHEDAPVEHSMAAAVVEQAVHAVEATHAQPMTQGAQPPRMVVAPAYAALADSEHTYHAPHLAQEDGDADLSALSARDLAREALRARIIDIAEQRHRRSAYEIAFILLAASVAVLLATPALVRVLLAARGIEV